MNDNDARPISDLRLLAAMQAVNPPLEKLMADRLALRQELDRTKGQLVDVQCHAHNLGHVNEVLIPRYIAAAKASTLFVATATLMALATALFTGLLELRIISTLFASLIFPLWLVDLAERRFGRWEFRRGMGFSYGSTAKTLTRR